jgi:hypothetical protein
MMRLSCNSCSVWPPIDPHGRDQPQSTICSSGTPIAWPVLRPRCWSGKNSTRFFRANAHSSTFAALLLVHTAPPCSPTNALSAAAEFMYVIGIVSCAMPRASSSAQAL